jgi:hypothetical protein
VALSLTVVGSWSCTYFHGADIGFTGGSYGIWTLEDISGKCQLWDILFFSYHLSAHLEAARFLSMAAMIVGLSMLTTMAQAQQAHIVSWGIVLAFTILFVVSVSTTSVFNIWVLFGLFSYVILTLIVRALFIHPVHRRISARGSKYIGYLFILCFVVTLLTLVILKSDYCTCDSLSTERLGRYVPGDPCEGDCNMGWAGYVMMVAALFWLATAVATFYVGVQPKEIKENPTKRGLLYAGYSRDSITTKAFNLVKGIANAGRKNEAQMGTIKEDAVVEDKNSNEGGIEEENNYNQGDVDVEEKNNEENETWNRTRCQKVCCDFRVTERSRKQKWLFWSFRTMLGFLVFLYMFLLTLLTGSRIENRKAEQAPDTSPYFITDVVCAFDNADRSAPFVTFPTADAARLSGLTVAHCGACAFCSNMLDIETYVDTRDTIATSAKKCGPKAVIGKYIDLVTCLEDRIEFTRECTYCWADNMKSTASKCLFTCMRTLFTGFMSNNNVPGAGDQGWLNQCLQCDEKLSGPGFVTCSGVARRRLGIKSEIERNPEEQCPYVGVDWLAFFGTS